MYGTVEEISAINQPCVNIAIGCIYRQIFPEIFAKKASDVNTP